MLGSLKFGDGMSVHYDSIVLDIADYWRSLRSLETVDIVQRNFSVTKYFIPIRSDSLWTVGQNALKIRTST